MIRQRVQFIVEGDPVVGTIHLPDGPGRHAAVAVAGPMTSVKEQVTGVYADALAERGIAALALDHRGFGESGGEPRQYEHSGRKIADLRAGLAFLRIHERIDGARLGVVGVCLGAGYAAWAAASDPLVRTAGFVAGYYRDPAEMRERDPAGFDAKVEQGVAARRRYEANGVVETVPAAALTGDAAMTLADTHDYYARRAAHPNYRNAFAVMSREHFLPFDVQAAAAHLAAPVTMVHGENALSPAWARRFHAALPRAAPILWLDSRGQTDFYDEPRLVRQAADHLAARLGEQLA